MTIRWEEIIKLGRYFIWERTRNNWTSQLSAHDCRLFYEESPCFFIAQKAGYPNMFSLFLQFLQGRAGIVT